MYCKNCGSEIISDARFCPCCGTVIEPATTETNEIPDETESQSFAKEESALSACDNSCVDESINQTVETTEGQNDDSGPKEESGVLNENVLIDNQPSAAEGLSQSLKNQNEAETAKDTADNSKIQNTILPQKGKSGRVKFKDLSKKQKILRLAIGGGLLLIALIWFIPDGVAGSNKAVSPGKTVNVISYKCDTGAVFDISLEEFGHSFSAAVEGYYNIDFNLNDLWGTPQSFTEDSGANYQFITCSTLTDVQLSVKTINNNVAGIVINPDYSSDTYQDNIANSFEAYVLSVLALGLNADEEQKIRKELADACYNSETTTSYITDSIKYTIIPDKLNETIVGFSFSIEPVSKGYVDSLDDNIIYNCFQSQNDSTS